jgi:hypothetical protein
MRTTTKGNRRWTRMNADRFGVWDGIRGVRVGVRQVGVLRCGPELFLPGRNDDYDCGCRFGVCSIV